MKTWIVLLRGINVGGNNIIKMADLRALLTKAGYVDVRTYIQSGNIALESDKADATNIRDHVQNCIQTSHGFTPKTLVLSADTLTKIIVNNPYPEAEGTPKFLHVNFLAQPAISPNIEALNALKRETDKFHITDVAVYAYLPEGMGNSKLATHMEKHLGVAMTGRNWRSANKILELARK